MVSKPYLIFGTRPEYLKIKQLALYLHEKSIDFCFVQILQHTDLHVEAIFRPYLLQIKLDLPHTVSRLTQLATAIPAVLDTHMESASMVLVQGDTATAFFAALTAFHHKIPIYHLEAGLRTYDLENPFPEEGYRTMISRITSYHLCPDEKAKVNLFNENISRSIHVVGNTILDLVRSYDHAVTLGNKVPITIHRRENWPHIQAILEKCIVLANQFPSILFEWILHPNPTLQKECRKALETMTIPINFKLLEPVDHKSLCQKLANCLCVITDSGGIQEEASFLGKSCFVMRQLTERTGLTEPYIYMVPYPDSLFPIFQKTKVKSLPPCHVYGEGNSCAKIFSILQSNGHI